MCARFTQTRQSFTKEWREAYGAGDPPEDFVAGYNIAPTDPALVVRSEEGGARALVGMRWGLIPFWAKTKKVGFSNFNARAETVATAPAFRDAFKRHRCVVPMDGYYEWLTMADGKQPYRVEGDQPLAGAGLWDSWKDPATGERHETFTILTTSAAPSVRALHERMPVFLQPTQLALWLDPNTSPETAQTLLRPVDGLRFRPVSRRLNNSKHKAKEDAQPVDEGGGEA